MNSGKGSKSEVFPNLLKGGGKMSPEEDWIAKWQYGYSGDFHSALFKAICAADEGNLDRLSPGFPDEVEGYGKYTRQAGW